MNVVTKSGGSALHGSVYEFLRNDALNAKGYFDPVVPDFKQNEFGGTMGGPVRIPKVYDGRNKTFFFYSFEGFRNRVGNNDSFFSVPTPEMYNGDFSNWVNAAGQRLVIYDPGTTTANATGTGDL